MDAPLVPVPVPVRVAVFTGSVMVCEEPALATGGVLVLLPVARVLLKNHSYRLGFAVKLLPSANVVVI